MYLRVLSRPPPSSGCARAAFNAGHIPASYYRRPADDLLSEVNKPAHTTQTFACLCDSLYPPPSLSLARPFNMRVSMSGHEGGGGLGTCKEQRLMGKQLHLQWGGTQQQLGQVRPENLIHWPTRPRHAEEQLFLSEMVDIGFSICCLPTLGAQRLCSLDQISIDLPFVFFGSFAVSASPFSLM